nr:hypothetical protein [Tanacetum cinerariifolium]
MMKLNGYVIMIICVCFLVLLVRYECSKIDVNDIKSIASEACGNDCRRTSDEMYCCCGDTSNNHTFLYDIADVVTLSIIVVLLH